MRIANAFRSQLGGVRLASWLRSSPDAVREVAFSIREETRQRLRLKRFLLASGSSIVYLLVLAIFTVDARDSSPSSASSRWLRMRR